MTSSALDAPLDMTLGCYGMPAGFRPFANFPLGDSQVVIITPASWHQAESFLVKRSRAPIFHPSLAAAQASP